MNNSLRPATPTWIGVVIGVAALVAVACFAIFLPKSDEDDAGRSSDDAASAENEASQEPLILPDRLAGGFVASDLPEAFVGTDFADQAEDIAANEAKNRTYADGVLSAVLDEVVATRVYAGANASSRISVKAFRAAGGAFAPVDLPDPALVQGGQPSTRFVRQDGAACSVTLGGDPAAAGGQPATEPPSEVTCQRSRDGVTVQVTAQQLALPELTTLLGLVLDELA